MHPQNPLRGATKQKPRGSQLYLTQSEESPIPPPRKRPPTAGSLLPESPCRSQAAVRGAKNSCSPRARKRSRFARRELRSTGRAVRATRIRCAPAAPNTRTARSTKCPVRLPQLLVKELERTPYPHFQGRLPHRRSESSPEPNGRQHKWVQATPETPHADASPRHPTAAPKRLAAGQSRPQAAPLAYRGRLLPQP